MKILYVLLSFGSEAQVWATWVSRANWIQVVLLRRVTLTGISQPPV